MREMEEGDGEKAAATDWAQPERPGFQKEQGIQDLGFGIQGESGRCDRSLWRRFILRAERGTRAHAPPFQNFSVSAFQELLPNLGGRFFWGDVLRGMNWKDPIRAVFRKVYARKLLQGVDRMGSASLDELRDPEFVAGVIRQTGLRYDRRGIYGIDNPFMNQYGPGLWQVPGQLARALVCLSQCSISSVLEIGTCDGWTSTVMAAYLKRFCPELRFVTVDIAGKFDLYEQVNRRVSIEYHRSGTVEDVAHERFDLVFIDGNHDYDWVAKDYDLAGRKAPVCMFHDVVDSTRVGDENVPRFWRELRAAESGEAEFHEFSGDPPGVMGIGIRRRRGEC